MLGPARVHRLASRFAAAATLVMAPTSQTWGQGPASVGPTSPPPAASGSATTSAAGAALTIVFLVAIVAVIVVVAKYVATRRKRFGDAAVLQAQLSDVIARESQFRGLVVTPKARVSAWCGTPITIEVAGDVPTPELREAVMRIISAEASRARPDIVTEDHLFIVPRAS